MLLKTLAFSNAAASIHASKPFLQYFRHFAQVAAHRSDNETSPAWTQLVSFKSDMWVLLSRSNTILSEHGRITYQAAGVAVPKALALSEILKRDGLAVEKEIMVSLMNYGDITLAAAAEEGPVAANKRAPTVSVTVTLEKSPDFNQLREKREEQYKMYGKEEYESRVQRKKMQQTEAESS